MLGLSRPTSPAAATPTGGSRAASPAPTRGTFFPLKTLPIQSPTINLIVEEYLIKPHEIIAVTPEGGISISDLARKFPGKIGSKDGQMLQKSFVKLIKENLNWDPVSKLLSVRR